MVWKQKIEKVRQELNSTLLFRNKYLLTLVLFFIWIAIFDSNSLWDRFGSLQKLEKLEKDKEYIKNKIIAEREQLNNLKNNTLTLEKLARELYYMKKKNEEVFVIIKPNEEENKK